MIDTIRYYQDWDLKAVFPSGWKVTEFQDVHSDGLTTKRATVTKLVIHNKRFGLRITCKNCRVIFIQANLPRLLFGHNGRLIKNQKELENSFAQLDKKISEIAIPTNSPRRFTRVDLTWQWKGNIGTYVLSHENAFHPEIRNSIKLEGRHSICWPGEEMKIRMYDKGLEKKFAPARVVRIEIELHGEKLLRHLGDGHGEVNNLNFSRSYDAFRKILLKFETQRVPRISNVAETLFHADKNRRNGTLSIFKLWARKKSEEQIRRVGKMISSLQMKHYKINWQKKLSIGAPPKAVEISDPSREFQAGSGVLNPKQGPLPAPIPANPIRLHYVTQEARPKFKRKLILKIRPAGASRIITKPRFKLCFNKKRLNNFA